MQLLVYVSVLNEDWVRLGTAIEDVASREHIEIFRRIESLRDRLSRPIERPAVMVMLAASQAELAALVSLGPLLYDLKTILVLPDRGLATAKEALRLSPRYHTYMDSDFSDLHAVLRHMFGLPALAESPNQGQDMAPGDGFHA